jgi:four helix bundle protein
MSKKKSVLKDKSFEFAIIKLYKMLAEDKREFVMSKQPLRSGTSVGANICEAQNAQSSADFIYKLYIAQKECDETLYWLELLCKAEYLTETEFRKYHAVGAGILKMLKSAILTTKQKTYNPSLKTQTHYRERKGLKTHTSTTLPFRKLEGVVAFIFQKGRIPIPTTSLYSC